MPTIHLETLINADIQTCFDLSRSIDLHMESTKHTRETAIAGRTGGLIELGETVTWRAKHFGIWQTLTSKITIMQKPVLFVDEMQHGAFKSFRHEHHFISKGSATLMTDIFVFESPLGVLGAIANKLFLTKYMRNLLISRNEVIKLHAELIK
ncbi:cell division protein [Mucilaginibacter sp. AW1-3]